VYKRQQLIAERAGLPKANVHYYFPTKETVYRAVLEQILTHWLGALGDVSVEDDPAEVLGDYIRSKLRASFEKPAASQVFAGELLRGAPVIRSFLEGELRDWLAARSRLIEAWAARGLMDPVSPTHLFMLIWAATQTYADYAPQVRAVLGRDRLSEDDLRAASATTVQIILKGCGIRAG
jgi:TetR/AcrR family transcriptional regulator